jgi:hypothetical protein
MGIPDLSVNFIVASHITLLMKKPGGVDKISEAALLAEIIISLLSIKNIPYGSISK